MIMMSRPLTISGLSELHRPARRTPWPAKVGEEVHLLAQAQETTLGLLGEVGGVPLRPTDRAEQHGIGLERRLHRIVRQWHAMLVEGGAADHVLLDVEADRALLAHPGDDLAHFVHDFGADAVARQHQQIAIGRHCLLSLV
jgi:hypothetical protein